MEEATKSHRQCRLLISLKREMQNIDKGKGIIQRCQATGELAGNKEDLQQ